MQWPVATSGQGVVDVVVQSIVSYSYQDLFMKIPTSQVPRATMVSAITGAEKGEAYWMQCQHYYKGHPTSIYSSQWLMRAVSAFTGENLDPKNQPIFTIGLSVVNKSRRILTTMTRWGGFSLRDLPRRGPSSLGEPSQSGRTFLPQRLSAET